MLLSLILASFSLATSAIAVNVTAVASDTFASSDGSLVFSLNIPTDSNDLYFVLSGSIGSQWLAVGLGSNQMASALILMAYGSSNGSSVTLSPRFTSGHVEPSYDPSIQVDILPGSRIAGNTLTINGRCANCRSWNGVSLDVQSTAQNMIFAAGPSCGMLNTDSKAADIRRHAVYGVFTMDLTKASGTGGIPVASTSNVNSLEAWLRVDNDFVPAIHACIMILAFLGFMPFGLLILRLFNFTRWHGLNQGFATLLSLIGLALGISCGTMYNRSKRFNSAHQIFGLIIMTSLVAQLVLGYMHHRVHKRTQQPTKMATIHIWIGRIVIIAGVANGFVGFPFANNTSYNYVLAGLTFLISLPVISLLFWKAMRNAKKPKNNSNVPLELFSPFGYSHSAASSQPPAYVHSMVPEEPWSRV